MIAYYPNSLRHILMYWTRLTGVDVHCDKCFKILVALLNHSFHALEVSAKKRVELSLWTGDYGPKIETSE